MVNCGATLKNGKSSLVYRQMNMFYIKIKTITSWIYRVLRISTELQYQQKFICSTVDKMERLQVYSPSNPAFGQH